MERELAQKTIRRARRTAGAVMLVTLAMAAVKGTVGQLIGSSALTADALHSGTDVVALGASWFGLVLASRQPTERFPYGFYRAETLGAAVASGLILLLGADFLWKGVEQLMHPVRTVHTPAGIATAAASAVLAYVLYRWERRVSRQTGSQSLAATAEEVRLDIGSSLAVLVALACSGYGVVWVNGLVTLGISGLVLWAGLRNLWAALLSLMDAAVDPELEREVAGLLRAIEGVREVEKVRARKSGPFFFVEGHVSVAGSLDVRRAHEISHHAQQAVMQHKPQVEGVILHIEPHRPDRQRVLVCTDDDGGLSAQVSRHFGRAPFFLVTTVQDGQFSEPRSEENVLKEREQRAGLAVVREVVERYHPNAVLCGQIGEIAFHALRDDYVEIYQCPPCSAREALGMFARGELRLLDQPTHSSEEKLE
jgi:cation diffusion facilitator family transporter